MAKKIKETKAVPVAQKTVEVLEEASVGIDMPIAFSLPNEKIEVRYYKRQTGFVVNSNHVAYGGKLEGALDSIVAKYGRNGKYLPLLTVEEQRLLESIMDVDEGYLSIYKPKDNYWDDIRFSLGKEGITLDLSDPHDYMKFKILLTYDDLVSPSILQTSTKKSYKYEIVRESDKNTKDKETVNYAIEAYKQFGKIEDSREQLSGVLRVLTGKSASTKDHDWLISEVGKIVAENPRRFVEVVKDPNYKIKLFIENGISRKAIVRINGKYSTKDGIDLCEEGEQPTLTMAIKFLENIKNQDIRLAIEANF